MPSDSERTECGPRSCNEWGTDGSPLMKVGVCAKAGDGSTDSQISARSGPSLPFMALSTMHECLSAVNFSFFPITHLLIVLNAFVDKNSHP